MNSATCRTWRRRLPHRLARQADRDRTPDDTVETEDPVIIAIAQRLGVHPAVVCVVWAVRRGQVPIPSSTRRANDLANLRGAVDNRLNDDDDMAAIDRNGRLIQGQVFLMEAGRSWEDLWDANGVMTHPE